MSRTPPTCTSDEVPFDTVARHLADELTHLVHLSRGVQEALSGCVFSEPPDAAILAGLQSIDRIGQGLADLDRLVRLLPAGLPEDATLPRDLVLSHLHLRELAERIVASGGLDTVRPDETQGEVFWL